MSDLREKIIDTALHLFASQGYHGVTVNQIVQNAGTSKGGFYHHFSSKDELLYVIHDTFITYALKHANQANQKCIAPRKKLEIIIKDFIKVFDVYQPHISVFYQESVYLKSEYEQNIRIKREQFKEIIMNVVQEGQQTGDFRKEIDVDLTSMAILGMVNWTYKWYKRSGHKTIEEIGKHFNDLILHAIVKT
ncbi:TetR/AcrR family transcriptional regulator [Virgibacillus soli]|uniref:TetR/AcrR family transcriptional regulator n=1 Tax=Paracerasibacillus soli TaxID=480284 RepID=UPI0035EA2CE7